MSQKVDYIELVKAWEIIDSLTKTVLSQANMIRSYVEKEYQQVENPEQVGKTIKMKSLIRPNTNKKQSGTTPLYKTIQKGL